MYEIQIVPLEALLILNCCGNILTTARLILISMVSVFIIELHNIISNVLTVMRLCSPLSSPDQGNTDTVDRLSALISVEAVQMMPGEKSLPQM